MRRQGVRTLLLWGLTLLFVGVTVSLGMWQLGRAAEKSERAAKFSAADRESPQRWLGATVRPDEFPRVLVQGSWQPEAAIYLDNRLQGGRPGYHLLVPLRLSGQRAHLLVNHGWRPKSQALPEKPLLPSGEVELMVRLMPPEQRYMQLSPDVIQGRVWQNLDWPRYQTWFGQPLVAFVGLLLQDSEGLLHDWPPPDVGVEKHYMYAGQWFLFAGLAVFLFVRIFFKSRVPR